MSIHTYDAIAASLPQITCPPDFSFPSHVIDKFAADPRNLLAIHWVASDYSSERKVTYAELSELTKKSAVVFEELGIKKGDRVLIQLPRIVEWWIVAFGLMRLGAIPIPGTSLLVAKDLKTRATASGATTFVGDAEACGRFNAVAKEVGAQHVLGVAEFNEKLGAVSAERVRAWKAPKLSSSDIAIIYFTSGTTGAPKQVILDNGYTLGHTLTGHWYRLSPGKGLLNIGDLGWAKNAYSSFGAFNHGAYLFVQPPKPGAFNPLDILETLHRYPVNTLCVPPTGYRSMITTESRNYIKNRPPMALEHSVSGGEPMNGSVIHSWREITGQTICDGWGQSETIPLVANYEGMLVKPGSMGRVTPGFEVAVLKANEEAEVGEEGELSVRTDTGRGSQWIFKGYIKEGAVDKRERVLNGKTWYCTGDRGFRDKDNYFWFVGRADDVITSSGYRIGPFEVESALKGHPAVLESAAVASPDALRNEIVKAFIIPSAEFRDVAFGSKGPEAVKELIAELQDFCRKETAPFKYPREIEFIAELPKTVSGKILRVELRNNEYKKKDHIVQGLKSKL